MCTFWVSCSCYLDWDRLLTMGSVFSVKGKKVLHIDRNDHYGGYVDTTDSTPPRSSH
jgi:hypothetical protein